jgi:hypothetical protein
MELKDVAELQTLLEGVALPAEKQELLDYAERQGATASQLGMLQRLPGEEFGTIDEVAETLAPVQPQPDEEVLLGPREESGAPPGGDAYTQKHPESGAVRA